MYKVVVILSAAALTLVVAFVVVALKEIFKTERNIRRLNKDESEAYPEKVSSSSLEEDNGKMSGNKLINDSFMGDQGEDDCFDDDLKIHSQKYYALSQEVKDYYDEVVLGALSVKGSKRYFCDEYEEYCLGETRLVRFRIHKGAAVCELVIPSAKEMKGVRNKYPARQNSFRINLTDETSVAAVKAVIRVIAAVADDCPSEQDSKVCDNCFKNNKR